MFGADKTPDIGENGYDPIYGVGEHHNCKKKGSAILGESFATALFRCHTYWKELFLLFDEHDPYFPR